MIEIVSDFETASNTDLKLAGAWAYSQCPTTEILCLVYAMPLCREPFAWQPGDNTAHLHSLAEDPQYTFVSHAAFEQAIWANIMVPLFGLPPLPPERWHDTQAVCAWRALPLGLDKVSKILRLPTQKDKEGSRLTIGLSKPLTKAAHNAEWPGAQWGSRAEWARTFVPGSYDRRPKTIERVIEYCKTDVAGEAELHQRLGHLSPPERKVWLLDQQINQRGIRLDMEYVAAAQRVVDRASVKLTEEFLDLTGGVQPGQVAKIVEWCSAQGVELENLQKGYLDELLGAEEQESGDYVSNAEDAVLHSDGSGVQPHSLVLPSLVRRALSIRQMLASASIKKLKRMRACVCDDGRARYLMQYHAAGPGRWGGRLLQPQNFPRGSLKLEYGFDGAGKPIIKAPPPQMVVDAIMTGDPDYVQAVLGAPPIECVASGLRHAIIADPGKVLEVGDFAGIEARMVLALAGQHDKCELMASGADVYLDMACDIYGVPKGSLNKNEHVAERTIGKNTVLGCGFQMGAAKFHDRYCGPGVSLEFAYGVIDAYRTTWAPKVPELWAALHQCAWTTVRFGRPTEAYGCVFRIEGEWMTITLPSGWQKLWYFAPAMRPKKNRPEQDGPSYMASKLGKWQQIDLYGGILTENVIQALARGLLVEAMFRLELAGHPLVLTVHDEAVSEVDEDAADRVWYEHTMAEPTSWSERIKVPVNVEAWVGERYKK